MKVLVLLASILIFSLPAAMAQSTTPISEIQGEVDYSPMLGAEVIVRGIVTAVRIRGFYIQTPDEDADNNPKTSEGLYISTADAPDPVIAPGKLVEIKGTVNERRPNNDIYSLYLTEIINPEFIVVSEGNPLPEPVVISGDSLKADGELDQLERFEGMRVRVNELTVVGPTGGFYDGTSGLTLSNGVFFGVLPESPRPFREPGIDKFRALVDKLPPNVPVYDMNPELIRVESLNIKGSKAIDVTSGATIKDIVGIIDYDFRSYALLIDPAAKPIVENMRTFVAADAVADGEISVASFNLENFFDDEENSNLSGRETVLTSERFEKRLKKASLAIRNVVMMPDVLGIAEVENLEALRKLANRINRDAVLAGMPDPGYGAILRDGNDPRGINVGFLVKTGKIRVAAVEQIGKEEKFGSEETVEPEALFARPPLLGEFEAAGVGSEGTFKFTVIINHFKSYSGIDDAANGSRVQNTRRRQAEYLAKFVAERESANPEERLILAGDFNAFEFNDGYNDLIGTLKGTPNLDVIAPASESSTTGLINLTEFLTPGNRYSYVFSGSAQTLDHVLINEAARKNAKKYGFARMNADFPVVYENDENRPERVSDHDVPVLYLSRNTRPQADEKTAPAEKPAEPKREATFITRLFYPFDRKGDNTRGSGDDDIGIWIDTKTAEVIVNESPAGDIFVHQGGGPNGAEWNPGGDLFLLISTASSPDENKPEIRLNGSKLSGFETIVKSSDDGEKGFFWIRIPNGVWINQLRDIEDSDILPLFGKELTERVASGETVPAAPLSTGSIIVFEIQIGDEIATRYFHADFGE